MKYTFIINPKSRSGKGAVIWNLLKPELKKRLIDHEIFYTKYVGHATEIAAAVTADDEEHILVVLGGDGSIGEVLTGIRDYSKVMLGYIPTGSGNDFTRELKLPTNPKQAFENVLAPGRIISVDVGRMRQKENEWRFGVSTGIGFDAAVCHQVDGSRMKGLLNKLHMGNLVYLGVALRRLFADKFLNLRVVLDDGTPMEFKKAYFAAVMNQPYEGGGFRFCPDAKVDDGMLDVLVVANVPRLKVLFLLPTAFSGKHVKYKGIHTFQCKRVKIQTDHEAPIHSDGQPIAKGRNLEAEITGQQIKVLAF